MIAPRQLPRLQVANDVPKRAWTPRVPHFAAIREAASPQRFLAAALLGLALSLTAAVFFAMRTPVAPPADKPGIPAPQATPSAKASAKTTDIVLPASSLLAATPPARRDRDVDIVADKIGDLPAAGGKAAVEVAQDDNGGGGDAPELLSRAHALLESRNYAAALDLYNRVLAADARSRDALAGEAFALAAEGSHDDAIATYRLLLELYPHDGAAAANLARLLMQAGQEDAAIGLLDQAARNEPDNLALRLELGEAYDRGGHRDQALMLYRQVAEAGDGEDAIDVPLASVRQRIFYLERLPDGASAPSTTRPAGN